MTASFFAVACIITASRSGGVGELSGQLVSQPAAAATVVRGPFTVPANAGLVALDAAGRRVRAGWLGTGVYFVGRPGARCRLVVTR